MTQASMRAPGASSAPAASFDWHSTDLGDSSLWPHTLRLSVEIMLGSPFPMLLVWGPRRIVAFNGAYAALAGPLHPPAPGGNVPALTPSPLTVAAEGFARAAAGETLHLERQGLTLVRREGPERLDCDLHLTPLRDEHGAVQGVLCAVARSPERAPAPARESLRVLVVEDNLD
jgi:hypothetical protein